MNKGQKFPNILLALMVAISPLFANISHVQAIELRITNISTDFTYPTNYQNALLEIRWETNEAAYSTISFGTDRDNLINIQKAGGNPTTSHIATIATPESETTYYFQIQVNINSQKTTSFLRSFKTPKFVEKGNKPQQSDLTFAVTGTKAVLHWHTDQLADGVIRFGLTSDDLRWSAGQRGWRNDHEIILHNLQPRTTYYYELVSRNEDDIFSTTRSGNFTTLPTTASDNASLDIYNLKPTSVNDASVTENTFTISFTTNIPAKSAIWIDKESGGGRQQMNTDGYHYYNHSFTFNGLQPETTYRSTIEAIGVNGKVLKFENITFATKAFTPQDEATEVSTVVRENISRATRLIKSTNDPTVYAVVDPSQSSTLIKTGSGWTARYYDHSKDHPDMNDWSRNVTAPNPFGYDWYDEKYLVQTTVDEHLDFGRDFFPLDNFDKEGFKHNFHFAVHWTGFVQVDSAGFYDFRLSSDDDAWIIVNGDVVANNSGMHAPTRADGTMQLQTGLNQVDVYFAERHASDSFMSFAFIDPSLKVQSFTEKKEPRTGQAQLHAIMNPAAFENYGYRWDDIEIVDQSVIASLPIARLVRTPDDPTVYLLNRGNRTKIAIPDESVFYSYGFSWDDVIVVNREDVDAYYNAQVVKTPDSPTIYFLSESQRRAFITADTFFASGFDFDQVITINRAHLESYRLGATVQQPVVQIASH